MNKEQLEIALTNPNIKAFLEMIRHAEGTNFENGYRYMFGSTPVHEKLFDDYLSHPGKYFDYTNKAGKTIKTSAAGAYQITVSTWTSLKQKLGLPDFSPHSQDIAALELINEKGAIADIELGHFTQALNKVKSIWASLPMSGNNQPERSVTQVESWYQKAGGTIA